MIENDKPVGVILTIEEYNRLQGECPAYAEASAGRQISNVKGQNGEIKSEVKTEEKPATNPIGEAMAREMDHPGVSAEIGDIEAVDDVTLEDLGIDELPY